MSNQKNETAPLCSAGCGDPCSPRVATRYRQRRGWNRTCGSKSCIRRRCRAHVGAEAAPHFLPDTRRRTVSLGRHICRESGLRYPQGFTDDLTGDVLRFRVLRAMREVMPELETWQREALIEELLSA